MNFELGKTYIVDVTEKGIIPLMEFNRSQWFNKDYDDLEFLTDEEKEVIVNAVLDKIRADVEHMIPWNKTALSMKLGVLQIIDKYRGESEGAE